MRTIRPATPLPDEAPPTTVTREVCACGSMYICGPRPDPTIRDAWARAHEGCEDGGAG